MDWSRGPARTAAAAVLTLVGALGLATTAGRSALPPRDGPPDALLPGGGLLELNHASQTEFEALPGIGPALARRIVADRETRGAFRSVDDLDRVFGIGPATLDGLRRFVCVRSETPSPLHSTVSSSR